MSDAVRVINLGLTKIGAQLISTITPPGTSLERYMAMNYPLWRDKELALRRWAFALHVADLTLTGELLDGDRKPYAFVLPNDCIRALRDETNVGPVDWEQRGRHLYSGRQTLRLRYVRRVPENEFDPAFVDVMACRVALEACEYVTQSNTKKADAKALYDEALRDAGRINAFTVGAERNPSEEYVDQSYSWLANRY